MATRRRRRKNRTARIVPLIAVIGVGVFYHETWLGWLTGAGGALPTDSVGVQPPALTSNRPEHGPLDGGPFADVPERGSDPLAFDGRSPVDPERASALLASARSALAEDDKILARAHFSEAMNIGLSAKDELEAQAELRKLSRDIIFSPKALPGDLVSSYYTIVPGDTLRKIAKPHQITAELLARINNIPDVHRIQAGWRIKIIEGPFHARVSKSTHSLDVFLGHTFVERFKVGLGTEDSTPNGLWQVKNKLKNPTYYPPRGGNIVAASDPTNPLGERWIGLTGIEGEAVGLMRYGIHGTVEPDSIGKSVSMGCIRMYNDDVEFLFDLLVEGKSTVEIRE